MYSAESGWKSSSFSSRLTYMCHKALQRPVSAGDESVFGLQDQAVTDSLAPWTQGHVGFISAAGVFIVFNGAEHNLS